MPMTDAIVAIEFGRYQNEINNYFEGHSKGSKGYKESKSNKKLNSSNGVLASLPKGMVSIFSGQSDTSSSFHHYFMIYHQL